MKALELSRKPARFAAALVAGSVRPGAGAAVGPLALRDLDPPELPGPEWLRLRPRLSGICGSDLSTIDGHASRYFEPIVSFPFVPGHEVVGDLDDGTRAVLVPVLHCGVRGIEPRCAACVAGDIGRCERLAFGCIEPGLQSGFCCDTGGGWSEFMVAHRSQLLAVPDEIPDEAAVLVEPLACAVHAAAAAVAAFADAGDDRPAALIGAGSIGLLTMAALGGRIPVLAGARYPHQKEWAGRFGATAVDAATLERAVRRATGSLQYDRQLTGGAPVVVDCVGTEESLGSALRMVAPGGTVLVVGMPAVTTLDLTGLWHREVRLQGVYAYSRRDFDTALALVSDDSLGLARLVSATYPLAHFRDAIAHAASAGSRGAVKIAFDLRSEKERNRV